MLIRNLFLFARNTFFSVKNLSLIKLEEPTPQWLKIELIPVTLVFCCWSPSVSCGSRPDGMEKLQLWLQKWQVLLFLSQIKLPAHTAVLCKVRSHVCVVGSFCVTLYAGLTCRVAVVWILSVLYVKDCEGTENKIVGCCKTCRPVFCLFSVLKRTMSNRNSWYY